jgi:hypothetical protein
MPRCFWRWRSSLTCSRSAGEQGNFFYGRKPYIKEKLGMAVKKEMGEKAEGG